MNNSDMPINSSYIKSQESSKTRSGLLDTILIPDGGLTKREFFAGLAMQGLLANQYNANLTFSECVEEAVSHADALLKELDKE